MLHPFDDVLDRRSSDSAKWRAYDRDVLPLWVADMDFEAPPAVVRAVRERAEHGVYGYPVEPPALREVVVARLQRLYGWNVAPEAILFLPGIVSAFNLACFLLTCPGQGIIVQAPVYPPILQAPGISDRPMLNAPLLRSPDGRYEVDLDAFEAAAAQGASLFLLCNPHNPSGRVFTPQELGAMVEICLRHRITIVSDEIHSDLVFRGYYHTPTASLDPAAGAATITLLAPSKTYNIAGLHCAVAIIENADLRRRFSVAHRLLGGVNLMGYAAALAAYQEGEVWLRGVMDYMEANRDFLLDYVTQHLPGVCMAAPEGTYLAWLDCRQSAAASRPYQFFLDHARVALNDGMSFGCEGAGFVRLNFGCPRSTLREAVGRMEAALTCLGHPRD